MKSMCPIENNNHLFHNPELSYAQPPRLGIRYQTLLLQGKIKFPINLYLIFAFIIGECNLVMKIILVKLVDNKIYYCELGPKPIRKVLFFPQIPNNIFFNFSRLRL